MTERARTTPHDGLPTNGSPGLVTPDAPRSCGAKTRGGGACQKPLGWGTDHPGQGRCKLHGGATPVKHGRYSKIQHSRLRELLEQAEQDPDPLDLTPELSLLRAVVHDYIERHASVSDAIIAWHASHSTGFAEAVALWRERLAQYVEHLDYTEGEPTDLPPAPPIPEAFENKPRQVPDIASVATLLGQIGAMADRIQKQQQQQSLSMAAVNHLLEQFALELLQASKEVISDPATRTKLLENVERRWATIPVLNKPGG